MATLNAHLRLYVDALGVMDALSVLQAHGGTTFYLPEHVTPQNAIADALGFNVAKALKERFPCGTYQVPKADKILMQLRDKEIVEALDAETTVADLARRYNLTRQHITNIYRDYEPPHLGPEQLDLF